MINSSFITSFIISFIIFITSFTFTCRNFIFCLYLLHYYFLSFFLLFLLLIFYISFLKKYKSILHLFYSLSCLLQFLFWCIFAIFFIAVIPYSSFGYFLVARISLIRLSILVMDHFHKRRHLSMPQFYTWILHTKMCRIHSYLKKDIV